MSKKNYLTLMAGLLGFLMATNGAFAQDESASAEGEGTAAAATAATQQPAILKKEDLKWNRDLVWISFIVDDGRVQSNRDYFGAIKKTDLNAVTSGAAKGMVMVQQVFYYNPATRQFSRFDATAGGATPILSKGGYFRPDSMMRIVPLNEDFVTNLAVRRFLNVEGDEG